MFKNLFTNFEVNNNFKSKFILLSFSTSQHIVKNKHLIIFLILNLHRIIIEWVKSIELKVNGKLKLFHRRGLIINPNTVFADVCNLRCNTVIKDKKTPIIGDIFIIGARTIITKDIPSNILVIGNPSKIIKTNIKMSDYV